jgi:hypothetical protein
VQLSRSALRPPGGEGLSAQGHEASREARGVRRVDVIVLTDRRRGICVAADDWEEASPAAGARATTRRQLQFRRIRDQRRGGRATAGAGAGAAGWEDFEEQEQEQEQGQ